METVWTGNLRDLVTRVAASDARETFVDDKTGAKISINISGSEEETDEPFYIEHGENLYDAYNRKDAVRILSNIRKGEKFPDTVYAAPKTKPTKKKSKRKPKSRSSSGSTGMMRMR